MTENRSNNITFIAEIGLNHNGNFGLFFELIKQAAISGADFAKFQLGWRAKENEINNLDPEAIKLIIDCCNYHSIKPLFSIFTEDAYYLAKNYNFSAYKIASRTVIDNDKLVSDILSENKRTFISLGMTDKDIPFGKSKNIEYLWCKSEYPALPWSLRDLPKDFKKTHFTGYSDHSIGIEIPLMAIARGATVIEKHFTLDKSDTTIRDHALSATPDELKNLIDIGRSIKRNLNLGV